MSVFLVTGGAGSLGRVLCHKLIQRGDKVRCLDINECALAEMNYPLDRFTKIYGDISDLERLRMAMDGVDVVIHCAALKNLVITENNPYDCIRINVNGTSNVSKIAIEHKIKHAIFLSSDKSISPTTLYGSTKQAGEHIWKTAGRMQTHTAFTIVRSGNFFVSSGNVFELWKKQKAADKPLTITHVDMERFFIEVEDLADIILDLPMENQTIVPLMKEYNVLSLLLLKYGEEQEYVVIGLRQGEKLREQLRYPNEKTTEINNFYEVIE
jgi:UDP-N-acetylglucosamine 4,6-dehydratase